MLGVGLLLPPKPVGQPEGARYCQGCGKRQKPFCYSELGVAGAEPAAPPLPPAVLVNINLAYSGVGVFWGAYMLRSSRGPLV